MRLLLLCIILNALLQLIAAQETVHNKDFRNDFEITNEPEVEPFHSCLGCDPCKNYDDGKDENGKGTRVCATDPNTLNGCISIYMSGLIRKCISDMNLEDISYCKGNEDLCVWCYSPDCNVQNLTAFVALTDGSASVRTSVFLFSICLVSWLVMKE